MSQSDFNVGIKDKLLTILGESATHETLNLALRLLAKWRSTLIQNSLFKSQGTKVKTGPLAGLDFLHQSSEGCVIAKLIGTYEQPLHESINYFLGRNHKVIINIGCAEGYYAVGLALKLPMAHIHCFDADKNARELCLQLAEKNSVQDRLTINGICTAESLKPFAGQKAWILCDAEGAENQIFTQETIPLMENMDFIIETHDQQSKGVTERLSKAFSLTHDVTIQHDIVPRFVDLPQWLKELGHLDQLLATWEWRMEQGVWLIAKSRIN